MVKKFNIERGSKEPWPEEYKANREAVIREFKDLGIEIETAPELLERLIELKEDGHFDDAVRMAQIIDIIPKLAEEDKKKLKTAALIHDIGKTGGVHEKEGDKKLEDEERKLVRAIYTYKFPWGTGAMVANKGLELIDKKKYPQKDELLEFLKKEGIEIDEIKMSKLWREHVHDGYEILTDWRHDKITQEIINMAVSHHIVDGENPAQLTEAELAEKGVRAFSMISGYLLLTLVDKYEAFRTRGNKKHKEAIEELKKDVSHSKFLSPENKLLYLDTVDELDKLKDKLEKIVDGQARAA